MTQRYLNYFKYNDFCVQNLDQAFGIYIYKAGKLRTFKHSNSKSNNNETKYLICERQNFQR